MPRLELHLPSPLICRWRVRRARMLWALRIKAGTYAKRSMDLTVAAAALLVLMPLLLLVALAIKLYDRGPVLFWQQRVGRDGLVFPFPKFRSMCVNAEARRAEITSLNQHGAEGVTFKLKRDPRITPVGRWLRRTSIDELPQLWSVLRGDMSLVGPRPALVSEVARYAPEARARLHAVPGLTCIWQVSGRSEIPFDQQLAMDLHYIRNASVGVDLGLLAKTVPAVIRGRGAY